MATETTNAASQQEIQEALALLKKHKENRAKMKERANDPERKAAQKARYDRKRISDKLLLAKAVAAGIKITDAEVEAEMKKGAAAATK